MGKYERSRPMNSARFLNLHGDTVAAESPVVSVQVGNMQGLAAPPMARPSGDVDLSADIICLYMGGE